MFCSLCERVAVLLMGSWSVLRSARLDELLNIRIAKELNLCLRGSRLYWNWEPGTDLFLHAYGQCARDEFGDRRNDFGLGGGCLS
jgi:hypothetical protein